MHFDAACDWHNNETLTPRKHVTKYKNMRKKMVEFIRNSQSRGNEIAQVNSICVNKFINLISFCAVINGPFC